jgi:hypothetical protein
MTPLWVGEGSFSLTKNFTFDKLKKVGAKRSDLWSAKSPLEFWGLFAFYIEIMK